MAALLGSSSEAPWDRERGWPLKSSSTPPVPPAPPAAGRPAAAAPVGALLALLTIMVEAGRYDETDHNSEERAATVRDVADAVLLAVHQAGA